MRLRQIGHRVGAVTLRIHRPASVASGTVPRVESAALGPPLPGVVAVDIDGRVSAYAPGAEDVVFLNETASQVWRLLDGTLDLEGLVRELSVCYGVQPAEIADDVASTVQSLAQAGLIAHTDRR